MAIKPASPPRPPASDPAGRVAVPPAVSARLPQPTPRTTTVPARLATTTKRHEPRLSWLPALLLGMLIVAAWQIVAQSGAVSSFLLPAPLVVLGSFWGSLGNGLLWSYAQTTIIESLLGFALGAAIALPLGYGIARSRFVARTFEPYVAASQALPAVALAPLLVLWLGFDLKPVVVLCALIVFFPAVVNTVLGIRLLDRDVLDAARVDGAGRWPLLWRIELPLALPSILSGLRTSLTLSITGAVVGEFVLGDQGLGGLLNIARGNFDTPLVFATLLTLGLLAAALYGIMRFLEYAVSTMEA